MHNLMEILRYRYTYVQYTVYTHCMHTNNGHFQKIFSSYYYDSFCCSRVHATFKEECTTHNALDIHYSFYNNYIFSMWQAEKFRDTLKVDNKGTKQIDMYIAMYHAF